MGEGRETFNRLLNWDRGQQSFSDIKSKFTHDLSGIDANNANGLAFVTNQEIRLSERKILTEIAPKIDVQIYHLERIASLLNTPSCYGIRMEFLDIEMSKEEQLSFFADNEQRLSRIESTLDQVAISLAGYKVISEPGALKPQSDIADDTLDNGDYEIALRSMEEVADVAEEFVEKIWFDRHLSLRYRVEQGIENVAPQIWAGALKSAERVIRKYGEENLGPYSDFEWGMLNGKLSALRWVLGEEWDMLDT